MARHNEAPAGKAEASSDRMDGFARNLHTAGADGDQAMVDHLAPAALGIRARLSTMAQRARRLIYEAMTRKQIEHDVMSLPLWSWAQPLQDKLKKTRAVSAAIAQLILPDGIKRPYRPCPPDFGERFVELGYSKEIEEHYRTNWRVIRRWIEEAGGDELRARRAAVSGGFVRPKQRAESRARRYVMGQTLKGGKV